MTRTIFTITKLKNFARKYNFTVILLTNLILFHNDFFIFFFIVIKFSQYKAFDNNIFRINKSDTFQEKKYSDNFKLHIRLLFAKLKKSLEPT